jgi:hypothetical protein
MAPRGPNLRTRILPSARTGLRTYGVHVKAASVPRVPGLSIKFDYAMEWNREVASGIDMRAGAWAAQAGYRFAGAPGKPLVTYLHMTFSGDDPSTPNRLEGYDAMYPDRMTTGYQLGAMAAFLFINSNNVAGRFGVDLRPTATSRLEVYAWHIRAQQLNSPISFGQGDRVDPTTGVLITGVQSRHLTDDAVVMYTHVFSRRVILSLGASMSWPGEGIELLGEGLARVSYGFAPSLVLRF